MKFCPNCGSQLDDSVAFCPNCGASLDGGAPALIDPRDHTAEFDEKDIAENKIYGILIYLASLLGVIIALLAAPESAYTRFHIRQCVKLTICELLIGLISAVLGWTLIVPFVGALCLVVLLVVQIICVVRACNGQAKEAPIVCKLGFLK